MRWPALTVAVLRPDLEVLCQGVEEGRRTFANTLKYVSITTSANFGNMGMLVFALTSSQFDLLTFWLLLNVFDASEAVFQTSWFVVSLLTELAVLLALRTHRPAWSSRPGTLLWMTAALVAAIALALPFSGPAAALYLATTK